MNESNPRSSPRSRRPAWNKGKMPGPKAAIAARPRLGDTREAATEKRACDLALFNLAVDS